MLKLLISECLASANVKLTGEQRARVDQVVARYIVKLSSVAQMRKALRKIGDEDLKCAILDFRKETIDKLDYFLCGLWRAVYEYVKYGIHLELLTKQYNVKAEDIEEVVQNLQEKDIKRIKRSTISLNFMPKKDLDFCMTSILKYARHLASRKMTFICKNDPTFDKRDFAQDLAQEGFRALRYYEHIDGLEKILNYSKRAAHNYCINLISYHKAEVRTVLREVKDSQEREYERPKVSIQETYTITPGDGGSPISFIELPNGPEQAKTPDDEVADKRVMDNLQQAKLSSRVRKFIDIVIGQESDPDFEKWLYKLHRVKYDEVQVDYISLGKYAKEYLNLSEKRLARKLGYIISPNHRMVRKYAKK